MKQNIRKLSILLFLVSLFISCSPEENFVKNKTAISLQDIKTKQINYNDFSRKTQYVKNKPDISPMISENRMARLATDTSDYVIYSDKIIETIFNDYTSYTMLLKTPNTTKYVYYNIVLEVRNNTTEVLILKYTKTESGILEETITSFRSSEDFPSGGSIDLKKYIEDFDNLGGGGSWGTSTSGSGGMPWTGLGGSQIYPSNCNGTVTTTYVLEPKFCASQQHLPGQTCEYLNPNYPQYNPSNGPYYELVPYYSCVPNPSSGTTNPPTSGGGNTGGPNSPDPQEDTSITAMIKPIECTERLEGDLNGDCQLSPYESCLKDGKSQEVCDCVKAGGNINTCVSEIIEEQIDDSQLDPCAKGVFEQIKNTTNNDFAEVLAKLGADGSVYNTTMISAVAPSGMPAQTVWNSPFNYTIYISTNYEDKTKLFIAASMLHELVHAYFMSLFDDYHNGNPPNPNAYNDFAYLFDLYVNKKYPNSQSPSIHHQQMAIDYADAIARALQEYDTGLPVSENQQPDQVYSDLAWGGLQEAPIFNTLFPEGSIERNRVINRYKCESQGNTYGYDFPPAQTPIGQPCN